jgi:hypothetical protein
MLGLFLVYNLHVTNAVHRSTFNLCLTYSIESVRRSPGNGAHKTQRSKYSAWIRPSLAEMADSVPLWGEPSPSEHHKLKDSQIRERLEVLRYLTSYSLSVRSKGSDMLQSDLLTEGWPCKTDFCRLCIMHNCGIIDTLWELKRTIEWWAPVY